MTIQEQNIVFVASQVMDDVPEGGGAATGTVVVDGQMNNVFEDISDLARAYGNFSLRKVFLAVRSLDTDLYGGAKTIMTALPDDPALGYALFTNDSPFDTRATAADRVAAYLYKGPLWNGALNENHITGMRAISVIQRVNTPLPVIGQTLCLTQNEGLTNQLEQYVRVIKVDAVETTFTDTNGDFARWIVTMTLSDALRSDFAGHSVNRYDSYNYTGKTRIRSTTVADATRFYGSQRLAATAALGALKIRAASMYTQLVPSAQTETALVSQSMSSQLTPMLASRASPLTYTVSGAVLAPGGKFVLDTGAYPGTISVTVGSVTITDDGAGNALRGTTVVGVWTYSSGECAFNSSAPSASGTATVSYKPAAAVAQQAHSRAYAVTAENRRLTWTDTLSPPPAPGTFSLAYMANGSWYVLSDTGAGVLSGSDAAFGAGTLSFVTHAYAVTLGALPDVGSQILLTWGSPAHTTIRVGNTDIDTMIKVTHDLGEAIQPGSLTLTWLVGGVAKTASAAASGVISGDCSGYVSSVIGELRLEFTVPPDANSKIGLHYQRVTHVQKVLTNVSASVGLANFSVGEALEPGSLTVQWSVLSAVAFDSKTFSTVLTYNAYTGATKLETVTVGSSSSSARRYANQATDDGAGHIVSSEGTVVYSSGDVVLPVLPTVTQTSYSSSLSSWGTQTGSTGLTFIPTVVATYTPAGASATAVETEIDLPPLQIRVIPRLLDESLVSGGLRFTWNGHTYVERAGMLYRDLSPTTGSGTVAGTVNLLSGVCTLTDYVSGAGALTLSALLTRFGDWTATEASFRAALAPIKPEALSMVAVTREGEQITGAADADGVISGTAMRGSFNYQFATGAVEFGHWVDSVWTPIEVDPSSITYTAVAYSYLPLDADILGIDPVRLPSDGRVPIYRAGDVVVVLHPLTNVPATPTLGDYTYLNADGDEVTVARYRLFLGRPRIGWVRIVDANGDAVLLQTAADASGAPLTGLDRANGVLYWDTLTGLATPLTVTHTVADLRMITDAQISGWLTLARPLSHDFPATDSIVAGCLIHGDRRARVAAVFDQASWDGVTWADSLSGSAAAATLNTLDYPVAVTNAGADTERWAFKCTSSTANTWTLTGEHHGLVWAGTYAPYVSGTPEDVAPINPRTRDESGQNGVPYLTIPQRANGGGWATGNTIFIRTVGAIADFWIARSVQQSDEPDGAGADGCELYALGNIDRP